VREEGEETKGNRRIKNSGLYKSKTKGRREQVREVEREMLRWEEKEGEREREGTINVLLRERS